jgi:hypothetical protein
MIVEHSVAHVKRAAGLSKRPEHFTFRLPQKHVPVWLFGQDAVVG